MSQKRLNHLMIYAIYQKLLDDLDELAKEILPREILEGKCISYT